VHQVVDSQRKSPKASDRLGAFALPETDLSQVGHTTTLPFLGQKSKSVIAVLPFGASIFHSTP
jgi:hypothetical protein